jgi:hypothetical protein
MPVLTECSPLQRCFDATVDENTYSGYVGAEPVVMFLNRSSGESISSMKSIIKIG